MITLEDSTGSYFEDKECEHNFSLFYHICLKLSNAIHHLHFYAHHFPIFTNFVTLLNILTQIKKKLKDLKHKISPQQLSKIPVTHKSLFIQNITSTYI